MAAPSVWDRQRAAVRDEITATAMELFTTQGFESTTIEQIVEIVGVSRRSFFRYFGTKEDVVLGDLAGRGAAIAEALAARPIGEGPWAAMRAALISVRDATDPRGEADLKVGRMLWDTPSLRARHLEKRLGWQGLLVPLIAARMPDEARPELAALAIVSSALACLDAASTAWLATNGTEDLADLYDAAVASVRA